MTDFAYRILKYVKKHGDASTWNIAQNVFPEKWKKRSGRGALIGHIDRVASKLPQLTRLPPRDQYGEVEFWLREELR